jgi:4-hydroxy-3-polyprenylbenzoate decarboxylase
LADRQIVVAVTGASGGLYSLRLLDCLEASGAHVHLVVSPQGQKVLADECGVTITKPEALIERSSDRITAYDFHDVSCRLASGSFRTDGMVVCPCSSNTLGAVASGLGDNLIARAACVTLKEKRRLVLVYREMPTSGIDLENMLRLQRAGAIICPANPGFYMMPKTIADLVDFVVGKILDLINIEHSLRVRWGGSPASSSPARS